MARRGLPGIRPIAISTMRSTDFITVHDFESKEPCRILPSAILAVTQLAETGRCRRRTKIDLTGGHVIVTDKTASEVMALIDAADNRSRRGDAATATND